MSKLTVRKFLLAVDEFGRSAEEQLFRGGFHFAQIQDAKSKSVGKGLAVDMWDESPRLTNAGRKYIHSESPGGQL